MSIILDTPLLRPNEITKSKHGEPKTSAILLISVAIIYSSLHDLSAHGYVNFWIVLIVAY